MTSFIAAGGSGRSTSVIPAVPAASSVTTIAFIRDLHVSSSRPLADWAWLVRLCLLQTADRDHPARLVIAIGDSHTAECFPTAHTPAVLSDLDLDLDRGGDVEWLAQYL